MRNQLLGPVLLSTIVPIQHHNKYPFQFCCKTRTVFFAHYCVRTSLMPSRLFCPREANIFSKEFHSKGLRSKKEEKEERENDLFRSRIGKGKGGGKECANGPFPTNQTERDTHIQFPNEKKTEESGLEDRERPFLHAQFGRRIQDPKCSTQETKKVSSYSAHK